MPEIRPIRRVHCFWPASSLMLVAFWATGQWLRDRTWLTGIMFYIPSPLICCWLLLAAWRSRSSATRNRQRQLCLALLVAPVCVVGAVENQWTVPESAPFTSAGGQRTLRLVHWNIGWPAMSWTRQRQLIRALDADLIVLSEVSDSVLDSDFAGYEVLRPGTMLVAAKWRIEATEGLVTGGAMRAFCVRSPADDRMPSLVIGDMASTIRLARDPFLRLLMEKSAGLNADIVVGDMNAPRRSLAFADLPQGYRHAYDTAGSGWSYSWPMPLPVLAIDQCIFGPRVRPIRYSLQSTMLSDHRIQILDFELALEGKAWK